MVGGEMGRVARRRGADLRLDERLAPGEDVVLEERHQPQDGRRSEAAGAGDERGADDGFSVQFRNAVHESVQVGGRLMGVAVPGRVVVGVPQTEVGAEIDDRLGHRLQRPDPPHGAAVRQAQEEDVARLQLADGRELERALLAKVRMDGVQIVTGVGLGGCLDNLDLGMAEEDA
jgi:hypothetical protein